MVHAYLYSTLYLLATLLALCAHAAPTPALSSLHARQANEPFEGPRTVQTRNVIPVAGGSIVEDCVVTFTPIVVDGENLVREERSCTELFVPQGSPLPDPPPPITTQDPPPPQTTSSPPPPETSTTPPPADTTTTTPPADTNTPPPTDTLPPLDTNTPPPADTNTPPADPNAPPTDTGAPQDPAPTAPPGGPGSDTGSPSSEGPVLPPSSGAPQDQQGAPTGTSANAESTQDPNQVNVPGKELEVVPIGLGVFAGISVIALIVVGLVTYERTKYRKAFRQRRLAASGQEMGYGGMSERR